jgi:Icc-related predicted phosphoesterase
MRIVCISDTHGLHRKLTLPVGDILIHAGDFLLPGASFEAIDDFNHWLGGLPHVHKIVIAGNHDRLFEAISKQARERLTQATYLENSGATVEGICFWGSPVTPVIPSMAFAVERGAASKKFWDRIPANTDVLVTHGPPFGILDKEDILDSHDGCEQLTKAVLRLRPALHVFGHIHGGYGVEKGPQGTRFVNCALLNGSTLREPIVVELQGEKRARKVIA